MSTLEILILCVALCCVAGFVVVCWKLTNAIVSMSSSAARETGRERLDTDRMVMQFIEKLGATEASHERIADLHAQETYRKWKMSEQTDQIREAAKHGQAQKTAAPPSREVAGVGPNEVDAFQ